MARRKRQRKPSLFGTGWKNGTFGKTLKRVAKRAGKKLGKKLRGK